MGVTMTTYIVERVTERDEDLRIFFKENLCNISELFDNVFDWNHSAVELMLEKGIFLVGRRNGEIRGLHISWLSRNPLDLNIKMLQQQLFYVKPDSGRMAYFLFKKFIDIGKIEANHIITMLTRQTNIKPDTLERLGFKELEVLYRLEV